MSLNAVEGIDTVTMTFHTAVTFAQRYRDAVGAYMEGQAAYVRARQEWEAKRERFICRHFGLLIQPELRHLRAFLRARRHEETERCRADLRQRSWWTWLRKGRRLDWAAWRRALQNYSAAWLYKTLDYRLLERHADEPAAITFWAKRYNARMDDNPISLLPFDLQQRHYEPIHPSPTAWKLQYHTLLKRAREEYYVGYPFFPLGEVDTSELKQVIDAAEHKGMASLTVPLAMVQLGDTILQWQEQGEWENAMVQFQTHDPEQLFEAHYSEDDESISYRVRRVDPEPLPS